MLAAARSAGDAAASKREEMMQDDKILKATNEVDESDKRRF